MATRSFRVLIADDNQANRALLRAYLGRLGFETVLATDGQQAVDVFKTASPDIVLMDVMMPNIDGFEAIRRIREHPMTHWVPILVVSSVDAEYDIVRGFEAGADDFLNKPLSYQVFAAKMRTIARTLEFQRAREESQQRESVVLDAVVDGIVTFDASGSIVSCNRAATDIFGSAAADLIGLHIASLLSADERPAFLATLERHVESGPQTGDWFLGRMHEVGALDRNQRSFSMELCISELPTTDQRLFIGVVRDISERKHFELRLAHTAARLQQYHDEAEAEAELAHDIMERHIRREGLIGRGVQHIVIPTQRFSGDIVLAARSPGGRLYSMLADATGHGLAAAMSSLSVVNDFYQAVAQDVSLVEVVMQINHSLCALLPTGRFVSAAVVCLDEERCLGEVWVGGVPDVLRVQADGTVLERYTSKQLPLGISEALGNDCLPVTFKWETPGHLLLCSDGVIEALDPEGNEFGYAGMERALRGTSSNEHLACLHAALNAHLQGKPAHDDISMLLLELPVTHLPA
ncbi:MAG TPA: SpoIIE family protein phosphatase [Rhodocyclaceae bacterium]|nr:SpoIIE family protein phosphatase [Rhodocyclaceae bacterium]